jgi:SAM-dependent methyltransferase
MYGENYGYRSGLNNSMVRHLQRKAKRLFNDNLQTKDSVVLDIGSNDGTLLNALIGTGAKLFGIDPTSKKFAEYYAPEVERIENFFSSELFLSKSSPADLIFSIAMFYDLDEPVEFVKQISKCLKPNGIWHFEMSYLPSMLDSNSFDTICHEHVEYYSMKSLDYILNMAGMRIIDIELNDINGGSLAVTACKIDSSKTPKGIVEWLRVSEKRRFGNFIEELKLFAKRVEVQRVNVKTLLETLKGAGFSIWGVGASTKGNVLLQYCGLDKTIIDSIADVNDFKFGRVTPGSRIPIKSEEEMFLANPEYALVLPWHFKNTIVSRSEKYLASGGRLLFPLPMISIVE